MIEMFIAAISTMGTKDLLKLREEYAKYVRKMEPQIAADTTGYYIHVPAGVTQVAVLASYKERVDLIDSRLAA